jgi:chromate reductase
LTQQLNIVGICGSLRQSSYSRVILRSIANLLPEGTQFRELDPGALPHYNEDIDTNVAPESVATGRALITRCDAVVIVTPEFNHGIPGVLKNTLDWLSRPAFASCFLDKPVMFATVAPGVLGGVRAQYQMRETLSSMLCNLVPLREIVLTQVANKLPNDRLEDKETIDHLHRALASFLKQSGLR